MGYTLKKSSHKAMLKSMLLSNLALEIRKGMIAKELASNAIWHLWFIFVAIVGARVMIIDGADEVCQCLL